MHFSYTIGSPTLRTAENIACNNLVFDLHSELIKLHWAIDPSGVNLSFWKQSSLKNYTKQQEQYIFLALIAYSFLSAAVPQKDITNAFWTQHHTGVRSFKSMIQVLLSNTQKQQN